MGKSEASKFARSCRRKHFFKSSFLPIIALFIGIMMLSLVAAVIATRIGTYGEIAATEQLRADVDKMMLAKQELSGEILAEVVKCNMQISSCQEYNRSWWLDFMVSDKWNDVKLIKTEIIPTK